jgi:hypothetical protein
MVEPKNFPSLADMVRQGRKLRRRDRIMVDTYLLLRCAEELEHICDSLRGRHSHDTEDEVLP